MPRSWGEIGRGDLVIAQDSPEEGWYDAIVVGLSDDMVTVRWRDYPRERQVVRHRNRLGLLYPGSNRSADTSKSPKAATAKQGKPTTDQRPTAAQPLAHDWQDIEANHLVLAKHDGPRPAWWEAIAIETKDDRVKVRWRDFPAILPISRSRFDLALLCADAG